MDADRSSRAGSSCLSARRSPRFGLSSSAEKRRGQGLGHRIVDELKIRARAGGYDDLCVFAHEPAYFAHMGFSIVPHTWLPEKIMADCRTCPLFRRCEQFAMVTDLDLMPEVRPAGHLHV